MKIRCSQQRHTAFVQVILQAEQYETYEWWYETSFNGISVEKSEKAVLCFEGVDCIAEYFLNGASIGKSDNMLIPNVRHQPAIQRQSPVDPALIRPERQYRQSASYDRPDKTP